MECRRVNQKYRDPHFDLDVDLNFGSRDCLDGLNNTAPNPKPVVGPKTVYNPQSVKRVADIFDKPEFFIDGPTANDVRQGHNGDCWLLAALCTLSNKSGLIQRTCVAHDTAVGVYGFVFHRDGEWFSEIIDDKLYLKSPDYDDSNLERDLLEDRVRTNSEEQYRKVYQSNSGALYFAQCDNPNETWLPLLEKAYAKAHGDYTSIDGGLMGEGIEDLTGGVTSELYATDILDKEYFWNEELKKVNDTFLFGCSTGIWGRGRGERDGIVEGHAYSVMRAVEMDGKRLVLLKNPWGEHEWKGPWSDGSKEWTADWIRKLDHQFGDDGSFWISYEDLLRKYQSFDRTRLFGSDWKVASTWTAMTVPWTFEYSETKFAFSLARAGPVVLVLSQLDDRYFRGLEGQYRFQLSFRLHLLKPAPLGSDLNGAGTPGTPDAPDAPDSAERGRTNSFGSTESEFQSDDDADYVVRCKNGYRMMRSVSVELDLKAGQYVVLVRIKATRDESLLPAEEVVRKSMETRREKLIRTGLAYDVAHSKGRIVETPAEKRARMATIERRRMRHKVLLREQVMDVREAHHMLARYMRKQSRREQAKNKAAQKRRAERRKERAEKEAEKEADKEAEEKQMNEPVKEPTELDKVEEEEPDETKAEDKGDKDDKAESETVQNAEEKSVVTEDKEKSATVNNTTEADAPVSENVAENLGPVVEEADDGKDMASGSNKPIGAKDIPAVTVSASSASSTGGKTTPAVSVDDGAVKTDAHEPGDDTKELPHRRDSGVQELPYHIPLHDGSGQRTGDPHGAARGMPYDAPPGIPRGRSRGVPRGVPHGFRPGVPRSEAGSRPQSDSELSSVSSLTDVSDSEVDFLYEDLKRGGDISRAALGRGTRMPSRGIRDSSPSIAASRGRGWRQPSPPHIHCHGQHCHHCPRADKEDEVEPWNAIAVVGLRIYYQEVDGDKEQAAAAEEKVKAAKAERAEKAEKAERAKKAARIAKKKAEESSKSTAKPKSKYSKPSKCKSVRPKSSTGPKDTKDRGVEDRDPKTDRAASGDHVVQLWVERPHPFMPESSGSEPESDSEYDSDSEDDDADSNKKIGGEDDGAIGQGAENTLDIDDTLKDSTVTARRRRAHKDRD